MKRLVQKLFVMFILIFTLNISVANSKSLEEVKLIPPDRLLELAKMGNPDAQYWLGELIHNGAIPNWQDLKPLMLPLWEDARKQGHALATYRLFEYINGSLFPDEQAKLKMPELKLYLNKLANAGEAKANLILFRETVSEFVDKRNATGEPDNLLGAKADRYLLRAYELGSRNAAARYSVSLSYGSTLIAQDHSLAVKVLEEAYAMKPDEEHDSDNAQTCNILAKLADYYNGEFFDGSGEDYSGEANDDSHFHTLSRGVKDSCEVLMFNYSKYLLENGKEEDFLDAYLVAQDALEMAKAGFLGADDYMYDLLGTLALQLKEPLKAKEHFSKMKDERWIEWLFSEYLGAHGFKLCSALDVPKNDCRAFIFN